MKTPAKVFEILDSFSEENPELTLTEIVNHTGYSKTATHRLLKTLLSYIRKLDLLQLHLGIGTVNKS